jgi:hypothetical protein
VSAAATSIRPLGLSPLLDHIRNTYSLAGVEVTMDLGGSRHQNVLLTTGYGMYIIRLHPPSMTLDRLLAIQAARKALALGGVPSTIVRPTRAGESWTRYDGQLVELGAYVDYHGKMDSWDRLEVGLPLLGRAHTILKTLSLNPAGRRPATAPHLGPGEVAEWTTRAALRLRMWHPDASVERFLRAAEDLTEALRKAEEPFRGRLPAQLVHGDFWDNSVLFRNGKVVLVTGLDFMGDRPRVEDLAWTLYRANSAFADDPLSARRLRRLRVLVDAYESGLGEPLSPTERKALPLAIARAPLFLMRQLALLERKEDVYRPIADAGPDLVWAMSLVDNLPRWQEAFA